MKNLLFITLLFTTRAFAQCDQSHTWVFSLSPGYAKTGPTIAMEAGLWPVSSRVGIMAGPVMYSWQETTKGKTETITDLDVTGRLVFKITELGDNSPQMFSLYGTVRGNLGISYRGYVSLGEDDLIGVEPFYGVKTGVGVNVVYTKKL